jgi:NADH:ubiquinone oxidoreductase subunit 6 (subunit J)
MRRRISRFFDNPYILLVFSAMLLASFLTFFYISWTLAGIAFIGAGSFFVYVIGVYRLIFSRGMPWLDKREDDVFMSLWYSAPLYILTFCIMYVVTGELWSFAFAAGGAAGILIGEWLSLGKEPEESGNRLKDEQVRKETG